MLNPGGIPGLGRRWLVGAILLVVGLSLLAAAAFYFGWIPGLGQNAPFEAFSPEALADYLPPDTAAAYGFDVRQILTASPVQEHFAGQLQQLAERGDKTFPWLKLTGMRLLEDVDRLRVVAGTKEPTQPLFLFQGRFARGRFQVGPGALEEKRVGRFRIYEYRDPHTQAVTILAPASTYLVVSGSREQVKAALEHAAGSGGTSLTPQTWGLLKGVDTKQGLWVAADIHRFGGLHADGSIGLVLNPIFRYARSVSGGMSFGMKLSGDFHFQAASEAEAGKLKEVLDSSCKAARGFAELLNNEWTPFLRLMGSGEVTRTGARVDLRCAME